MTTYKIVRHYFKHGKRTVKTGLTKEEAQKWCKNPETSSRTCTLRKAVRRTENYGPWFDGYTEEK